MRTAARFLKALIFGQILGLLFIIGLGSLPIDHDGNFDAEHPIIGELRDLVHGVTGLWYPVELRAQNSINNPGSSGNFTQAITSNITYYVCSKPGPTANCAYNGDGGTGNASNPSDSNACVTKTAPCATIAGVFALITNKLPLAVITLQLADTAAGSSTDCYAPNNSVLTLPSYTAPQIFPGSAMLSGLADAYPPYYVYLVGNTTTPSSVTVNANGGTNCSTKTVSASNGLMINGGIIRVRGITFLGYGSAGNSRHFAANAVSGNRTLMYAEDINCTGNEDTVATAGGVCIGVFDNSILKTGGTWTVLNTGWISVIHSTLHSTSPLNSASANTTITYTNASTAPLSYGVNCLDVSDCAFDHFTYTLYGNAAGSGTGAGAYTFFQASQGSDMYYAEWYGSSQCPASACLNGTWAAASVTAFRATENGYIDMDCSNGSQTKCAITNQPAVFRYADRLSMIDITQDSTPLLTAPDQLANGGCFNNWNGGNTANTTCGESTTGPGSTAGATYNLDGVGNIATRVLAKGTINSVNDIVCVPSGSNNTVNDCTSTGYPVGFASDITATQAKVILTGKLGINLDASVSKNVGDRVCLSDTTAGTGRIVAAPGVCVKNAQVGVATFSATNAVAQTIFLPAPPATYSNGNTAASSDITATASKTYFSIGNSIPANMLQTGVTITVHQSGIYSGNNADTLTNTIDICITSVACGTPVNIATTSAITLGAVSNQYWECDYIGTVYSIGASGTINFDGKCAYETAANTMTIDPTPKTGTVTVDTTVQQFINSSVTFSSNNGANHMQKRVSTMTVR